MNEPTGPDAVPQSLRVDNPVGWLERHDRDPELHWTVRRLLSTDRVAEAVTFLEWHIGQTATVRARVAGWDTEVWASAVQRLSQFRSRNDVRAIKRLLKETRTTERTEP